MNPIIIIILVLVILILVSPKMDNFQQSNYGCKTEIIKSLMRQSARWAVAAAQDSNAMVAVLHANYAAGYLWALKDIATDNEIQSTTGVDVLKFRDQIVKVQDTATRYMASLCPEYAPESSYLAEIAGDV